MSGAPARGTVPRRQRRHHHHHHHHQKHQKRVRDEAPRDNTLDEPEEKRPKVNPIFLWASQREQRIIEVRCEDYDKRNRIKLTKTAQGWRSIPRTTSNVYTIATASKRSTPGLVDSSQASPVASNDEKENGKRRQEVAPTNAPANSMRRHPRKYSANGATNGLLTGEGAGRKRRYDEEVGRRGYSYPLGLRDGSKWKSAEQGCPDEDNDSESEREEDGEEACEQSKVEDRLNRLSSLKCKNRLGGRVNLERLQKDKLFQPRVVLEQLHLSQLPESAHQNVVRCARTKDVATNETRRVEENDERDEEDTVDAAEAEEDEEDDEKENEEEEEVNREEANSRVNKAGIQDILNMIDATASPVLATDTPSADLPVDSTKTYEVLSEKSQTVEREVRDTNPDDAKDRSRISSYQIHQQNGEIDEKLGVHEEKILEEDCCLEIEDSKIPAEDNFTLLSMKDNPVETMSLNSCKIAEADGSLISRSKCRSNSIVTWSSATTTEEEAPLEIEEEAPDEPGEPLKIDFNDNSKILDALRNTPGLSVSVTRNHTPEIGKNPIVLPARPSSKASSSSRSPDSQAECVEKLLKNSNDFVDNQGRTSCSPRNLPGLSIIIPSYRYRSMSTHLTTTSPSTKNRVESPESTVSFNKADAYSDRMKLDRFPHEGNEEEEDEDDCDSQVLEDLRRQKTDSLAYDNVDADYYNGSGAKNNHEDRKTPLENTKSDWSGCSRSSEAQAKCRYQDLEHFDEQVLEELRSRGTVVSPQPSGIPCSPASRRPSSAYLERLLPSPPCSVSCSEDAKSELTLKSILASSSCTEPRDYDKSKEAVIRSDSNVEPVSRPVHSSVDRNVRRINQRSFQERLSVHRQEARNSGRPMSSGDIHSTFYTSADRVALKRPMSAEWQTSTGQRHKNQMGCYQKVTGRIRNHLANHQDQEQIAYATSSSTDKLLDPANQLRELVETVGHLIPDPLLVPRSYLPGLAAAPATEIPKLLASRPELRLPEALTRPDLLRDPDLLVISLAHLQHVLDHGEGPVSTSRAQPQQHRVVNNGSVNKGSTCHVNSNGARGGNIAGRPKLSCKPIGTLMPAQPIDLSSSGRSRVSPCCPPLLRVRSGLLKQEPEVSSTASSPDESQLWHPLFGR
ncbi:hypothetical protein X777_10081 [Ooceraea biroi]|uniref:Uncharacterized protein n=1 Tax=Ooceraea biroi TaxID=2015173 RepID=A0A026X357_OOCBI|nr:hypothetical protein X777_10081 [Ooceraea biroi]